jgi:hypothetical protein
MSDEPPIARWRAAKLAAVAADLGRLGHDLRGILAPALLAAERAQASRDPAASRAAEVMVRAVDRATEALNVSLASLRHGLPVPTRTRLDLRAAVDAVPVQGLSLHCAVPAGAAALANPSYLAEVLDCLFAYARCSGAKEATVALVSHEQLTVLRVSHRGRPPADGADLFSPPAEADAAFDLPIAHELARAMRGSLVHAGGTSFDLALPTADLGS